MMEAKALVRKAIPLQKGLVLLKVENSLGGTPLLKKTVCFFVFHNDQLVGKSENREKAAAWAKKKGEESQGKESEEHAKAMETLGKRSIMNEKGDLQPLNQHSDLQETIAIAQRYAENEKPQGARVSRQNERMTGKSWGDYDAAKKEVEKLKEYAKYMAKKK